MADPETEKTVKPVEESVVDTKTPELNEQDLKDVSGGAGVLINKR